VVFVGLASWRNDENPIGELKMAQKICAIFFCQFSMKPDFYNVNDRFH